MRIEHIALSVRDLTGAKAFFETYFDGTAGPEYHNPRTGFRSYFVSFEGGARLELTTRPGLAPSPQEGEGTGYVHLAFSLGSEAEVDALTVRLRADGYPTLSGPRLTGDGYYESCIAGFEGNQIELTV